VVRSPTSKPSRPLTFTKQRVCAPLTVNGRTGAPKGPTVRAAVWLVVSATVSRGDFNPAR
jgi:hypothetical protein